MSRKNIVWLASYPKSGNTWARIFLANYLLNTKAPMPINQVHRICVGDSIADFYRRVAGRPIDTNDIAATIALRPKVLSGITANNADVNLVKTHLPNRRYRGVDLIPSDRTRAAVYILRNPFDMVLSYARHYATTHEQAVTSIGREDSIAMGEDGSVVQPLGHWSDHVRRWTRVRAYPLLVLRFEDMKRDPHTAFAGMLEHIGVPVEAERLDRAIRFSSFDEVKRQEQAHGFIEKPVNAKAFFVSGETGHGRAELSAELRCRIEADHGATMRAHGYL